ncbi:CD83 antigen [Tupaia chinensis]|uniref:CD83 antigen n=1 Tax=Tupaia chinensis TaxID=246437 RepID=L9L9D1_TUPCH|nr:CD83 antigen [Tupaia chinensis]
MLAAFPFCKTSSSFRPTSPGGKRLRREMGAQESDCGSCSSPAHSGHLKAIANQSWAPFCTLRYTWHLKLSGDGGQRMEAFQGELHPGGQHSHHKGQNDSFEVLSERPYSLKIRNTTNCNAGTYTCTLQDPEGQRNLSGTVILKVTGCSKRREENFKNYRAEIFLLLALVVFYLTLIIFTCTWTFCVGIKQQGLDKASVCNLRISWLKAEDTSLEKAQGPGERMRWQVCEALPGWLVQPALSEWNL